MAQAIVEQQLMKVAKAIENQVDDQIHAMENMDDDDIERLRQRRIDTMKRQAAKKQEWLAKGHGQYSELLDEKEFFAAMKGTERMVCHFYRENWPCKVRGARGRVAHWVGGPPLYTKKYVPPRRRAHPLTRLTCPWTRPSGGVGRAGAGGAPAKVSRPLCGSAPAGTLPFPRPRGGFDGGGLALVPARTYVRTNGAS